ncbi:hypothetical protein AUS48_25140 [Escherichia coli]|nr:hypothetical protein AUS48_25140 [Escherichia coli]KYV75693.1 hypothetical protein AMK82_23535 [Escherichia coli]
MTSLKTSIKTITYLSDIGCLEIQGASLSYISFSSGLLWYFLIVIHRLTSSLDIPVSVIRVVHDALCHRPLLSLSMQVFLL